MARGLGRPLAIAAFLLVLVGAAGPAHNEAVPSWAGFGGVSVTEMLSQRLGLPGATGVIVTFVHPEGPATKAGLHTRDVILRAGDESIDDGAVWSEWVSEQVPGTRIALIVQRQGQELSLLLTIEELPAGVEPDGR